MLSTLGGPSNRKRHSWSLTTIAASVGIHLLLLGGAIFASTQKKAPPAVVPDDSIPIFEIPVEKPKFKPAPKVPRVPASVPTPKPPANPGLVPPKTIPPTIAPEAEGVQPVDPGAPIIPGDPRAGGDPDAPIAGDDPGAVAQPGAGDPSEPYTVETVHVRPSLANPGEVQRMLRRLYPALLRESEVTGTVVLQFVIGADGRVEPSTIQVISTTHPAFSDAAVEAASKLRFEPARLNGNPVRLLTSMPIRWRLDNR